MAKDSSLSPPAIFIITPLVVYVKQKNTKYNKKITEGSLGDGITGFSTKKALPGIPGQGSQHNESPLAFEKRGDPRD